MSRHGLTIVEAVSAMAVFMITTGLYFHFTRMNSTSKANIEKRLSTKEVMLQNLIEIKGNPIGALPPSGSCRIRTYKMDGRFEVESIVANVTTDCGVTSFDEGKIYLLAKVQPATSITATFNPAATMKLPQYSNQIYQIDLRAVFREANGGLSYEAVSIFKR